MNSRAYTFLANAGQHPGPSGRSKTLELKLSVPNFAFPALTWEQSLQVVRVLGVRAIDVGVFATGSNLTPRDLIDHPSSTARRITAELMRYELQVADVFGIPGRTFEEHALNHFNIGERKIATEFFWRLLEFAARCNTRHLTLLPGVRFQNQDSQESSKRAAEELVWRREAASRLGIVLAVEPHVGSIIETPETATQLVDRVPGLTLTLDYSHFAVQGIPYEEIEPLFGLASHFHLRAACQGKLQASFKENTVDFARIIAGVQKMRYDGYLALEYLWTEWMGCNEIDNISEISQLLKLLQSLQSDVRCSSTFP